MKIEFTSEEVTEIIKNHVKSILPDMENKTFSGTGLYQTIVISVEDPEPEDEEAPCQED